jgi:hypothetical protein
MDKKSDIPTKKIALDTLSVLSKGTIAQIPILGAFVVEALNTYIPDQRLERMEKILQILSSKLCNASMEEIQQRWETPEFLDIFEDCMNQGIRAISDERLEYLASVLENSLTEEQLQHHQTKRLLSILAELNDAEVIWLCIFLNRDHKTLLKYQEVLKQLQGNKVNDTFRENYETHMERLGLLKPHYKIDSRKQQPEIDPNSGAMKIEGYKITFLGELLLQQILNLE